MKMSQLQRVGVHPVVAKAAMSGQLSARPTRTEVQTVLDEGGVSDVDPGEQAGMVRALADIAPRTRAWAKIVGPVAGVVLGLGAAVILAPFLFYGVGALLTLLGGFDQAAWTAMTQGLVDWATIVLAPVVGFVSTVLGYYFGYAKGSGDGGQDPAPPAAT